MPIEYALVAQLDRVLDYESRGQGFESLRARHVKNHLCLPDKSGFYNDIRSCPNG